MGKPGLHQTDTPGQQPRRPKLPTPQRPGHHDPAQVERLNRPSQRHGNTRLVANSLASRSSLHAPPSRDGPAIPLTFRPRKAEPAEALPPGEDSLRPAQQPLGTLFMYARAPADCLATALQSPTGRSRHGSAPSARGRQGASPRLCAAGTLRPGHPNSVSGCSGPFRDLHRHMKPKKHTPRVLRASRCHRGTVRRRIPLSSSAIRCNDFDPARAEPTAIAPPLPIREGPDSWSPIRGRPSAGVLPAEVPPGSTARDHPRGCGEQVSAGALTTYVHRHGQPDPDAHGAVISALGRMFRRAVEG